MRTQFLIIYYINPFHPSFVHIEIRNMYQNIYLLYYTHL